MSPPHTVIPPTERQGAMMSRRALFAEEDGENRSCGSCDVRAGNPYQGNRQPTSQIPVLVRPKSFLVVRPAIVMEEDRPVLTVVSMDTRERYQKKANLLDDANAILLNGYDPCRDRASGAKNPCLEENEIDSALASSLSSWRELAEPERGSWEEEYDTHLQPSQTTTHQLTPLVYPVPHPSNDSPVKGRHCCQCDLEERDVSETLGVAASLVCPIAIRIACPQSVERPGARYRANHEAGLIPRDINRESDVVECRREDALSPLTPASRRSSSRSNRNIQSKDAGCSVCLFPKHRDKLSNKHDPVPDFVEEEYSSSVSDDTNETNTETNRKRPADANISSSTLYTDYSATAESSQDGILRALVCSRGETDTDEFQSCLDTLTKQFKASRHDTRHAADTSTEGLWLVLTKPSFSEFLGVNDQGDKLYSLGRMFSPTSLICSLQGNFNLVERVPKNMVPGELRGAFTKANCAMQTHNIVTAFTIEPCLAAFPTAINKDIRRPVRGIMTTFGYTLPDPDVPNRHTFWVTGGRIEPNGDPKDQSAWNEHFNCHPPRHKLGEITKFLAARLVTGATIPTNLAEDGSMEYTFKQPVGGPGKAHIDVLYVSETLRIVRGHSGNTFVFSRLSEIPNKEKPPHEYHQSFFHQNGGNRSTDFCP